MYLLRTWTISRPLLYYRTYVVLPNTSFLQWSPVKLSRWPDLGLVFSEPCAVSKAHAQVLQGLAGNSQGQRWLWWPLARLSGFTLLRSTAHSFLRPAYWSFAFCPPVQLLVWGGWNEGVTSPVFINGSLFDQILYVLFSGLWWGLRK